MRGTSHAPPPPLPPQGDGVVSRAEFRQTVMQLHAEGELISAAGMTTELTPDEVNQVCSLPLPIDTYAT